MSRRERAVCLAVTALMAAFIALAPGYISGARQQLSIRNEGGSREPFQGIITLWHIAAFKPYQGSLGSWLSQHCEAFEELYGGIYLEVDSISPEEALARIERGERADIYSFPLGWADVEQLRPLELEGIELSGNLAEAGRYEGRLYAQPYAASGYVVAANLRIIQEQGIEESNAPRLIREGALQAAGSPIAGAVYGAGSPMLTEEDFLEEKAAAALVDARAAGDLSRRIQEGKGFAYTAMEYGNYSDLVQLLGISRYMEEEKLSYAMELIGLIMEAEPQRSLCELGLAPALKAAQAQAGTGRQEGVIEIIASELRDIAAPNSFLYKAYRDQLDISAQAALSGDAAAQKDFELRVGELVRGAVIK